MKFALLHLPMAVLLFLLLLGSKFGTLSDWQNVLSVITEIVGDLRGIFLFFLHQPVH